MPRLLVERGNEKSASLTFADWDRAYVVGRGMQCDLVLTDFLISRQHFRIEKTHELFTLIDLGSHNGTYLNGERLQAEAMLCFGDLIRAGQTLLSFDSGSGDAEGELAGQKIGGYHLLTRIGVGGMGEVYRAVQVSLGRAVALKVLSPELTADRWFVERFVSEARAAAKLNHPNVVAVHEVGEAEGYYYISMELISGGSVQDMISEEKRVDPFRATEIVLQAARALEYAEKVGIVHRDVKPDNLMLTEAGEVRLADLGIAKALDAQGKADQTEGVFGSPHYMAPEQARGLALDHRADQYALGVTYYRMLSGKLPFTANTAREVMEKQVFEAPEPLQKLHRRLPPLVYEIVGRMLRKKPAERYPGAAALIADLERALSQICRGGAPSIHPPKAGRRLGTITHVRGRRGPR